MRNNPPSRSYCLFRNIDAFTHTHIILVILYQDLENNSTLLCYSKNNCRFMNYLCMNLSKSTPSYSTRVRVEYLYLTQYSTPYLTRGRVTRPRSINFTIWLLLDLGHQLLVFALTMNLESGRRFADIW